MASDIAHIRHFSLYELLKESTSAIEYYSTCHVYWKDAIDESICRRCFRNSRKRGRSCKNGARCGRSSLVMKEDLDQAMKRNLKPTVPELAESIKYIE